MVKFVQEDETPGVSHILLALWAPLQPQLNSLASKLCKAPSKGNKLQKNP